MNVFLPCNPGDLSINTRDRGCIKKGRIVHNEMWTKAFNRAVLAIREAANECGIVRPMSHPCTVVMATYLPRKSRKYSVPLGDVDNSAKAILDALTKAGVWDDDALCMDLRVTKHYAIGGASGIALFVGPAKGGS